MTTQNEREHCAPLTAEQAERLHDRIAELEKQLQGERQLRQESEGMGLCMSMVHDDLVQAGVVPAGTAPMFITEAAP